MYFLSDWGDCGRFPQWHAYKTGDVFQTDGALLIVQAGGFGN